MMTGTRLLKVLLLVGVLLASIPLAVTAGEPVAMITDCGGDVAILRDSDESKCELLQTLENSDQLVLASGANIAVVYFSIANEFTVNGPANVSVGLDALGSNSGNKPVIKSLGLAADTGLDLQDGDYRQAGIIMRNAADNKTVKLLYPRDTNIVEQRPTFSWKRERDAVETLFTLQDEYGREIVRQKINGNDFVLPDTLRLEAGQLYTWEVSMRIGDDAEHDAGNVFSNSAYFMLLAPETNAQIEKFRPAESASLGERVRFALLLEKMELHHLASEQWQQLLAQYGDNPALRSRLDQ